MWTAWEICERITNALAAQEASLRLEQAVKGLDSLSEVLLHPVLASGLREPCGVVLREVPYPGKSAAGTQRRERDRCDLVLLPPGEERLIDPLDLANAKADVFGTLFEAAPAPVPKGVEPEDAYWLEIKVVSQWAPTGGVPGANRAYGSELVRSISTDLAKLSGQTRIEHGGLALVVFTDSERTGQHDVMTALERCAANGVPMRSPELQHFGVVDRIGNADCTVAVVPRRGTA